MIPLPSARSAVERQGMFMPRDPSGLGEGLWALIGRSDTWTANGDGTWANPSGFTAEAEDIRFLATIEPDPQ